MKQFEFTYLLLEHFLSPLHKQVRRYVAANTKSFLHRPDILDVGGRKSHYTIGLDARIIVTDLPRETEIQRQLELGIDEGIVRETYLRRSNVQMILLDDMTHSSLPDSSFDCVLAIEVLEHVEQDKLFLKEVWRVLRSDGIFFMTTPNGDSVANTNKDHKRHYTRNQLCKLLEVQFDHVNIVYAVHDGFWYRLGLESWSIRHPWQTMLGMFGNFVCSLLSANGRISQRANGTRHLIATAHKTVQPTSRHDCHSFVLAAD